MAFELEAVLCGTGPALVEEEAAAFLRATHFARFSCFRSADRLRPRCLTVVLQWALLRRCTRIGSCQSLSVLKIQVLVDDVRKLLTLLDLKSLVLFVAEDKHQHAII